MIIIKQLFRWYDFMIRANQCSAFNCESVDSLLNSSTNSNPARKRTGTQAQVPQCLCYQDTLAPRHFGTYIWCRSVPDTSAPVPKCLQALVPKCLKTLREGATCRLPGDTSRMLMELQSWNFTVIMIQASTRGDPWMETFHKFMSEFCVSPTIHVSWPNLSKIGRCEVAEKSSGIAYKKRRVRDTF